MNKGNRLLALTVPLPLMFLSKLSNKDEVALVANLGKVSLARSISAFSSKLPITLPNVLP